MLVTFSCPAYGDITMFGQVALRLLIIMGHSDTVPGAIIAEDVQLALERLETAVAVEKTSPTELEQPEDWDDEEQAISLSHRALPLIELLRARCVYAHGCAMF